MNVFADAKYIFQLVPENGKIRSQEFINAARQVSRAADILGTVFLPIKSDVLGNCNKLQKKYDMNPEAFSTINAMLDDEIENNNTTLAKIGGLWLKRGLEAWGIFCMRMVDDHKAGIENENLGEHWWFAYERTLKKYHSWIVQQLVKVITKAIPYKRKFLTDLCYGNSDKEVHKKCLEDMEAFIVPMMDNLKVLSELYITKNLDADDKV